MVDLFRIVLVLFFFRIFYFRSQSFDQNPPRSFQDSTRPFANSNFSSGNNSGKGISQNYLINHNDVPRLIGKGGEVIKQIQRDYDVRMKIDNNRQNEWVDLFISGSNDQAINNAMDYIRKIIGSVKEKDDVSQSKSFFQTGIC
jgi:hypothetical protein